MYGRLLPLRQSHVTGASILGFNSKGCNSSNGKVKKLSDIVADGISVISYLLSQGINYKDVVLQGRHEFATASDCEVVLYLYKEYEINFLNI